MPRRTRLALIIRLLAKVKIRSFRGGLPPAGSRLDSAKHGGRKPASKQVDDFCKRSVIAVLLLLSVLCAAPVTAQDEATRRTTTGKSRSFNRLPSRPAESGKIAFQCRLGDLSFICTVNADGTDLRQIAEGSQPVWSPDGSRLAFTRSAGSTAELYVVRADGSDLRLIADGYAPDWSPDGKRLAFTRLIGSRTETFIVNADGRESAANFRRWIRVVARRQAHRLPIQ